MHPSGLGRQTHLSVLDDGHGWARTTRPISLPRGSRDLPSPDVRGEPRMGHRDAVSARSGAPPSAARLACDHENRSGVGRIVPAERGCSTPKAAALTSTPSWPLSCLQLPELRLAPAALVEPIPRRRVACALVTVIERGLVGVFRAGGRPSGSKALGRARAVAAAGPG
jgi:hypothetical protein